MIIMIYDYCYNLHFFTLCVCYLINSWKLLSENLQVPPLLKKSTHPFYSLLPKNSESASPPFGQHWKFFSPPFPAERGGENAVIQKLKPGKCSPCLTNLSSLCCKQIRKTNFKSRQFNKIYNIFHNVNCAIRYAIYLMKCILCNKQYVGKTETSFNIRLNNHRKDVKKLNATMACKHF